MYTLAMKRTPNVVKVLAALRVLNAPTGYALAQHAQIPHPTAYRVLARLLEENMVAVRADGTRRRYYLTPLGETWAEAWTRPPGETVTRVRRKAELVNVIRWSGNNLAAVSAFVGDALRVDGDVLWIRTVNDNEESCRIGWWIVEGVLNKYPIPPEVFSATYEVP